MTQPYLVIDNPRDSNAIVFAYGVVLHPGEWYAFPFADMEWAEVPIGAPVTCSRYGGEVGAMPSAAP